MFSVVILGIPITKLISLGKRMYYSMFLLMCEMKLEQKNVMDTWDSLTQSQFIQVFNIIVRQWIINNWNRCCDVEIEIEKKLIWNLPEPKSKMVWTPKHWSVNVRLMKCISKTFRNENMFFFSFRLFIGWFGFGYGHVHIWTYTRIHVTRTQSTSTGMPIWMYYQNRIIHNMPGIP